VWDVLRNETKVNFHLSELRNGLRCLENPNSWA
jgi:hypothetical protein